MTTDERIEKLAASVAQLEQAMRQAFAALRQLHNAETRDEADRAFQKLDDAISALEGK
jgi:hypothetical protein